MCVNANILCKDQFSEISVKSKKFLQFYLQNSKQRVLKSDTKILDWGGKNKQ